MSHREATHFGSAAIATPHYLASGAGAFVLSAGGNAVDALVAANLVLGVVSPYLCGYGGDLFALVWDGSLHGYRSAGRSSAAATLESVPVAPGEAMPVFGPHTVTAPGAVRGWFDLLDRFGTRSFAELAEAALHYARDGFPVTAAGSREFELVRALHQHDPWSADLVALYSAEATSRGARLEQPRLAATIELLSRDGPDAFYRGPIAASIADTVAEHGGTLGEADLSAHAPAWTTPLSTEFGDYDVYELPPPTQGVTALEALAIADGYDLHGLGDTPERDHLLVESVKQALADRDSYVTDPDFMSVTASELFSPGHIATRRAGIDPTRAASPVPAPGPDGGTAYLCAADASGMAVSLIQSNFIAIGSGLHVRDWGLNLHNRGSSFSLEPDHVNALAPNKLPMHTLIPAMVFAGDVPSLVFGTMGGHGQAQTHLQVLTKILIDGRDIQSSITAARWTVDPTTWALAFERRFGDEWSEAMATKGHDLRRFRSFDDGMGHAHAIRLGRTSMEIATDPRCEGAALGL